MLIESMILYAHENLLHYIALRLYYFKTDIKKACFYNKLSHKNQRLGVDFFLVLKHSHAGCFFEHLGKILLV